MKFVIISFVILAVCMLIKTDDQNDYYKLLGIHRDATNQEIRKAFKALALKLHPDKNKDEPDSEEKFIALAKAYEVLKDPTTRKQYDLYGEGEFRDRKQEYQSYTYYRDHFGIYDDDPLIVTLSINDYQMNVLDVNQIWFINFYSPHCYHCHELAPTWTKLASELEGVVRIAAVNCEEDYALCYQLSIHAYPTLLFYEKETHMFSGEGYKGPKTLAALTDYVLSKIKIGIETIGPNEWNDLKHKDCLLILCDPEDARCLNENEMKKLTATLEALIPVRLVSNKKLRTELLESSEVNPILLWKVDSKGVPSVHVVYSENAKEVVDKVLNILPNPPILDEKKFHDLRTKLRVGFEKPWLFCFYLGAATDLKLELKKLPTVIPNINIGLIHCGKNSGLCASLHVVRYPTWAVIKEGGAFEVHHGRDVLHEVAAFARDSTKSSNMHALSPADFQHVKNDNSAWFIDWFAPWCPPCKRLTPEMRKASQHFSSSVVQFGTIDCTLHGNLCSSEGIDSYPTLMLYNGSTTHRFIGAPSETDIVGFIQEIISPIVISLDDKTFSRIGRKTEDQMWIVNFYAPWCSACKTMELEYRNFAQSMSHFKDIFVAKVNCQVHENLCNSQYIQAYPTIRLYPVGSEGMSTVAIYSSQRKASALKQWVLSFLPSKVETLIDHSFSAQILYKNFFVPWLVDFYAPWCNHCVNFDPEYRQVAQMLEGKVHVGKIDCETHRVFCGQQRVGAYPTIRLYLTSDKYVSINGRNAKDVLSEVRSIMDARSFHDEL